MNEKNSHNIFFSNAWVIYQSAEKELSPFLTLYFLLPPSSETYINNSVFSYRIELIPDPVSVAGTLDSSLNVKVLDKVVHDVDEAGDALQTEIDGNGLQKLSESESQLRERLVTISTIYFQNQCIF